MIMDRLYCIKRHHWVDYYDMAVRHEGTDKGICLDCQFDKEQIEGCDFKYLIIDDPGIKDISSVYGDVVPALHE